MRVLLFSMLFLGQSALAASPWPYSGSEGSSGNDTARVRQLNMRCQRLSESDPDSALKVGRAGLSLARSLGFRSGEAQAMSHIGHCLIRSSDFAGAKAVLDSARALYQQLHDPCGEAGVLYNMGLRAQMLQEHERALEHFLGVLKLEEGCGDGPKRSTRLYAIGSVYVNMLRYEEAKTYFQQAIALDSAARDSTYFAQEHVALANAYAGLGDLPNALAHYELASRFALAHGDSLTEAYVQYNIADIEREQGNAVNAVAPATRAVALLTRMRRMAEVAHASLHLGDILTQAGRPREAEHVLLRSLHLADSLGLQEDRVYSLLRLAQAHEALGDNTRALAWYKRHLAALDSAGIRDRDARLDEMTARFETEKKEKELIAAREQELISQREATRQRNQRIGWTISALLLAAATLLLWNTVRTKRRHVRELEQRNTEVLRQKERAEESERAKDRFLANMSHELRTPLNAITGFTDLLLHDASDERHRRFLTAIRNAGDNLLMMINDVLDLGRIEAGRYALNVAPFDLHRCVRLCADMLQARALDQQDELQVSIAEDVPRTMRGDSARLTQILLNILGNALKFTERGRVALDVSYAGDMVRFTVTDTGIGIPSDKLPHIFDRFAQVHESDQRKYGGTGLGLAIVKELVALHQGTIDVRSVVGRGTTFEIALPYETASLEPAPPPATARRPAAGSLAGRTILIAEDNEVNVLVTQETLARFHPAARTIVAKNGREALDFLREDGGQQVALVLMDVQMPELDGIEATRAVRALPGPVSRVPIIALTASVLPGDLSRCIDAGMDACLTKPFRTENLLVTIERLVGDPGAAVPSGSGLDRTAYHRLFQQQVPQDLAALQRAIGSGDAVEVARIVHLMRPQLVHHDKALFAPLCDKVLRTAKSDGHARLDGDVRELIGQVEHALSNT